MIDNKIEVEVEKWIEAKQIGNYNCPSCANNLIVVPLGEEKPIAYCTGCGKSFVGHRKTDK